VRNSDSTAASLLLKNRASDKLWTVFTFLPQKRGNKRGSYETGFKSGNRRNVG
jgi:hypothetical protein